MAAELRQTAARSALRTSMSSRLTPADEPELQAIIEGLAMCLNAVNMRSFRPWLWPRATFRWTSLASQLDAFNARTEAFVSRIIEQRTRELLDQRARSLEVRDGVTDGVTDGALVSGGAFTLSARR